MALRKFPQDIKHLSWNSKFKESWSTTVQTAGSGMSRSLTNQVYPKWTITESVGLMDDETAEKLLGFVALVKGAYEPFLWYDHSKNHETGVQLPMTIAGTYQAVIKTGSYTEPADYIEDVTVYKNGTKLTKGYSVSNGLIIFSTAPASTDVITADYAYWWKVRFVDDGMGINRIFENLNSSDSFKMEVVR